MVDHAETGFNIVKAIVWAIMIFLVGAIIDAVITVFVFKKYGGCPMMKKTKVV
jgi:hypothetical protein